MKSKIGVILVVGTLLLASVSVGSLGLGYLVGRSQRNGPVYGPAMMGQAWFGRGCRLDPASSEAQSTALEDVEAVITGYLERYGYDNLHITELMEFEQNYYAIVAEDETDIGAMELLVDKSASRVFPEYGPNMMWNTKYGMHRGGLGMMGWSNRSSDRATISPAQAREIAQRWLDAELPGRTAGTPDPFYGYYTIHTLKDGEIDGMLSVHATTGKIWYHNWHGEFIRATEHES